MLAENTSNANNNSSDSMADRNFKPASCSNKQPSGNQSGKSLNNSSQSDRGKGTFSINNRTCILRFPVKFECIKTQ
jgi:hypothetical protein